MLSFFQPRYRKDARLVLKNARKLLHHRRDLLKPAVIAELEKSITDLQAALAKGERAPTEEATKTLEEVFTRHLPPPPDAGWRENVEVFLVAVVVALGVRTYFLQPFTIPTGSMQPTLNGIIGHLTDAPPPNYLVRAVDFVLHGRKYVNTVAKTDDTVLELRDHTYPLLAWTTVVCTNSTYTIYAPADTLRATFDIRVGAHYAAGEVMARGYIDTGDHVFVDKFSYHFRAPQRGNVFVFSTAAIPGIENGLRLQGVEGSQFYIKRLAGTPGDSLRIAEPQLFINGQLASEPGFTRVMTRQDGYHGYQQGLLNGLLGDPEVPYTLPPESYLALGDNSFNSRDSRYWGTVPEGNIMGRALFVYWPFLPHWGLIH